MADTHNNQYLLGFHFSVSFIGLENKDISIPFQEVSGLSAEIQVEEVAEGGVNTYVHRLPKPVKHGNLILKKALSQSENNLTDWIKAAIERFEFKTCQVTVSILGIKDNKEKKTEPLKTWIFEGVYPVKVSYSDLNAQKGELVIQTLELAYQYSSQKQI